MIDLTEQLAKLRELDQRAKRGWVETREFEEALRALYRNGGRELMEAMDWLTRAEYVEVQIAGKLFRVDGGRLLDVIAVARAQDTNEEGK